MQHASRLQRNLASLAFALGMALTGPSASAALVYTYTSDAFPSLAAPLAPNDRLVFEFETAAALSQGLFGTPFQVQGNSRWRFSIGSYAIESTDIGAVLYDTYVYTNGVGDQVVFCGSATRGGDRFYVNSGTSIGQMLIGTSCSSMQTRYQGFSIAGGPGAQNETWGTWAVRQGTIDPPLTGGGPAIPEPGSLLLSAAALLALGLSRVPARRAKIAA